jgi:alanine racemase
MDQCVVDVSAQAARQGVHLGDEIVMIGRQGDAVIRAEDAAARVGTNNYDIVSRILPRVPRVYLP